jgi:hypothetical protein
MVVVEVIDDNFGKDFLKQCPAVVTVAEEKTWRPTRSAAIDGETSANNY